VPEAAVIVAIARDTGWSEDHIRSGMSWARALLYWHAIAYAAGVQTVAPMGPVEDQLDALLGEI
jgi:hypothetical protein